MGCRILNAVLCHADFRHADLSWLQFRFSFFTFFFLGGEI
ncbi:pentapeptide repeat-containing protein [Bartonella apihabitans]